MNILKALISLTAAMLLIVVCTQIDVMSPWEVLLDGVIIGIGARSVLSRMPTTTVSW